MPKKSRLKAFMKGMLIVFTLTLIIGGAMCAWEYFSLNTVTISQLANSFVSDEKPEGPMEGEPELLTTDDLSEPENTGDSISFDAATYPYRQLLNSTQQAVYNQIYANAMAYNTETFTTVSELTTDELCDTMNSVFYDHPEIFWLNTSYKYGLNSSNKVVQVQLSFGISQDDLNTAKDAYNSAIATIVSGASEYTSEIEKELYVHDAICSLASYDSSSALNQSAYSALVNGSTVCAGYARAFQNVCQELGLTCYYVTGTSNGEGHAWNIISIDGDFYNVDVTWDDSISEKYGSSVYPYFNLTDEKISNDHTRSTLSSRLYSCTATAMSYTNVYGSTIEIDDITNDNNRPITDGNFTIKEPADPIVEWRHPGKNSAPSEAPSDVPSEAPGNTPPGEPSGTDQPPEMPDPRGEMPPGRF